jgi:hypothetical protein
MAVNTFWDQYTNDAEKETRGTWQTFGGGLELKIARADIDANSSWADKQQTIMDGVKSTDVKEIQKRMPVLYSYLVTDAKGLVNQLGEPVEFSQEFIGDMLKKLPELLKEVILVANNFSYYRGKVDRAITELKKP